MKIISNQFERMEAHGALATNIALWFTMLSPLTIPIITFLGAWFFNQPTG